MGKTTLTKMVPEIHLPSDSLKLVSAFMPLQSILEVFSNIAFLTKRKEIRFLFVCFNNLEIAKLFISTTARLPNASNVQAEVSKRWAWWKLLFMLLV